MLPVYDAVIGIKKEKNHPKRFRKFLASQWNKLVSKKVFLHYKDTQTGAKFFKKEFLKDAHFQTKGFAFDVELLLHLQKKQARIIEFPLSIKKQTPSTITLQSIREMRQELHSIAKSQQKFLALTFDVEETDFLKDKWSASSQGTKKLLQLLANKPSTFFVTQTFAEHHKKLLQKISKTHEVASHGISHKQKHIHIQAKELEKTRLYLEKIIQKPVYGFRAPRFEKPSYQIITRAGFLYDSSLHPTIVPGRYNNFFKKRNPHVVQKLKELPPSVTPFFRIPLSYVSFRLLPLWLLHLMTKQTLKYSPGIILYFHPFEFVKLPSKAPWFQRKKTGPYLLRKLENYLKKYPQLEIITLEKLRRRL